LTAEDKRNADKTDKQNKDKKEQKYVDFLYTSLFTIIIVARNKNRKKQANLQQNAKKNEGITQQT